MPLISRIFGLHLIHRHPAGLLRIRDLFIDHDDLDGLIIINWHMHFLLDHEPPDLSLHRVLNLLHGLVLGLLPFHEQTRVLVHAVVGVETELSCVDHWLQITVACDFKSAKDAGDWGLDHQYDVETAKPLVECHVSIVAHPHVEQLAEKRDPYEVVVDNLQEHEHDVASKAPRLVVAQISCRLGFVLFHVSWEEFKGPLLAFLRLDFLILEFSVHIARRRENGFFDRWLVVAVRKVFEAEIVVVLAAGHSLFLVEPVRLVVLELCHPIFDLIS